MENKEPEILYEDSDILVVNKPTGLVVHGDGKTEELSVAHWVLKKYPEMKDVGEPAVYDGKTIVRPGIVHRIDRETSGVLVLAKNKKTFEYLKRQFQDRKIKKTYNAFVYDVVQKDHGIIEKSLGRHKTDFRMWAPEGSARGEMREAVTLYRMLKKGSASTYLELSPQTGRTHQIRVHLKSIGHPVVCDKLYAPKKECILGFSRLALHARSIAFSNDNNEYMEFESPLPEDFKDALAGYESV